MGGLLAVQHTSFLRAEDRDTVVENFDESAPVFGFTAAISEEALDDLRGNLEEHGEKIATHKPWLFINSPGGDADAMIELSELVDDKFAGVVVGAICHSACAELLMTIEKPVILTESASIKFHMNPIVALVLLERASFSIPNCIQKRADWYEGNFEGVVSAREWSHAILDALEFKKGSPKLAGNTNGCSNFVFQSRNPFYVVPPRGMEELTAGRVRVLER
ncbi:hypothetical protein [uncultured Erythrobacter sp.]|uniref:hypothetical protein n=1 Tax=uncultured Erythrobacter sp. TaxID=263913 RepID=UPI0026324076|nr:hypothetical protein [uncultured Erythrobacter sp.]